MYKNLFIYLFFAIAILFYFTGYIFKNQFIIGPLFFFHINYLLFFNL